LACPEFITINFRLPVFPDGADAEQDFNPRIILSDLSTLMFDEAM
jgi:hypothetical protein